MIIIYAPVEVSYVIETREVDISTAAAYRPTILGAKRVGPCVVEFTGGG